MSYPPNNTELTPNFIVSPAPFRHPPHRFSLHVQHSGADSCQPGGRDCKIGSGYHRTGSRHREECRYEVENDDRSVDQEPHAFLSSTRLSRGILFGRPVGSLLPEPGGFRRAGIEPYEAREILNNRVASKVTFAS